MLLIQNGYIADPKSGTEGVKDILIRGERIEAVGEDLFTAIKEGRFMECECADTTLQIIDATGLTVLPGLIDVHTHFRDPGFTYKEDIHTGALSAAAGGFTTKVTIPSDGVYQLSVIHSNQGDPTAGITAAIRSVYVDGEDVGRLIGKNGRTMEAINSIIHAIAINTHTDEPRRVSVDIGNYRAKRREYLVDLAKRKAEQVKTTGRAVRLNPMPARERVIVHLTLQDVEGIITESEGTDPQRYLVIKPGAR